MRLRKRKITGAEEMSVPYCFLRRHVTRAESAADLLRRAIADRYSGLASAKHATQLIYEDEGLLRAALVAASTGRRVAEGAA